MNDVAVFVRVAQFESFRRAAHALGMSVSIVSRKMKTLEERLGVTLLWRTTRKLSLRAQGRGSSPEIFVHAVYPTRRFLPEKLQVFLEDLKAWKSPLWMAPR